MDSPERLFLYLAIAVAVGALLGMVRYLRRIAQALEAPPPRPAEPARLQDDSHADFTAASRERQPSERA